jgi:hypothetical protein
MAPDQQRRCPDCKGPTHEIRLIDKAHGSFHTDFEYSVPEAKKSFWTGAYPIEGKVVAFLCDACGRIQLFGAPKQP